MEATGFVLAGGKSTRMGRDKALLPYRGRTLVEVVASTVGQAAGSVAIIGDPARYRDTGYPVYPDRTPCCGPIGGVWTALSVAATAWNLVVACDMPLVSAPVLRGLIDRAFQSAASCVVAAGSEGEPHPLCAVYHRRCLAVLARAIRERRFTMRALLVELDAEPMALEPSTLANINTLDEWLPFADRP